MPVKDVRGLIAWVNAPNGPFVSNRCHTPGGEAGAERAKRSAGLHKRSAEDWGSPLWRAIGAEPLSRHVDRACAHQRTYIWGVAGCPRWIGESEDEAGCSSPASAEAGARAFPLPRQLLGKG